MTRSPSARPSSITSRTAALLSLSLALTIAVPRAAQSAVTQADLEAARALFAEKKYPEAAEAFQRLRDQLAPQQTDLAPTLDFNRACALMAADQLDAAETALLATDARAATPHQRAAARYNLGLISARRGDAAAESDRPAAIEAYRRAERHFRNALADRAALPPPSDTAAQRNIDILQRTIARLLEEQEKQEQQQQQEKNEQNQDEKQDQQDQQDKGDNNDQQNKDQQKQDQQKQNQPKDQQQKPDQPQSGDPSNPDKQEQDQQNKPGQDEQTQPPKPTDESDAKDQKQQQPRPGDAKPDPRQPAPTAEMKAAEKREFDRLAAEILDKEKEQRERMKQLMQLMRQRAAPVEKDW